MATSSVSCTCAYSVRRNGARQQRATSFSRPGSLAKFVRPAHVHTITRSAVRKISATPVISAVAGYDTKDDLLSGLSKALTPTPDDRLLVNERLTVLEAANPTESPAFSPLLQGEWEVVYCGGITPGPVPSPTRGIALLMYAGGFSPGAFALEVARFLPDNLLKADSLTLNIGPNTVEAVTTFTAFSQSQAVTLKTMIAPESSMRLKETYEGLSFSGRSIDLPDAAKFERTLFVTYLDDTLMVARDETGAPDILVRKSAAPAAAEPKAESAAPTVEVVVEDAAAAAESDNDYLDDIGEVM